MSCPLCNDRSRPEDCEHMPEFLPPTKEEEAQYEQDAFEHGWQQLKEYARSVHRDGAEKAKGSVQLREFCACGHPTIGVGGTTMCAAVAKIDRLIASDDLLRKENERLREEMSHWKDSDQYILSEHAKELEEKDAEIGRLRKALQEIVDSSYCDYGDTEHHDIASAALSPKQTP